jgi:energy-converting hydrogenase Eha subunit G
MASFTKLLLSGSTQGKAIKIAATTSGSAGTTIHATGTGSTAIDEVWLYAYNSASTATALTIQWGGVTAVDNEIKITIPPTTGLTLVVPGLILTGSGGGSPTASTIAAYAGTTNVITVSGYVNRIS